MLSPAFEQTMVGASAFTAVVSHSMRHVTPVPPGTFSPAVVLSATPVQECLAFSPFASFEVPTASAHNECFFNEVTNDAIYDSKSQEVDEVEPINDTDRQDGSTEETTKLSNSYLTSLYFPVIVHRMIREVSSLDPIIMRWNSDGTLFWIEQEDKKRLGEILKQYFKRTSMCRSGQLCYECLDSLFLLHPLVFQITNTSRSADSSMPTNSKRSQLGRTYSDVCECSSRRTIVLTLVFESRDCRMKGYWQHPIFRRDSLYDTLLTCKVTRRQGYQRPVRQNVAKSKGYPTDTGPKSKALPLGVENAAPKVVTTTFKVLDYAPKKAAPDYAPKKAAPTNVANTQKLVAVKANAPRKVKVVKPNGWLKAEQRATKPTPNEQRNNAAPSGSMAEFNGDISPANVTGEDLGRCAMDLDTHADDNVPPPYVFSIEEDAFGMAEALTTLATAASLLHPCSFSPVVHGSEHHFIRESAMKNSKLETSTPTAIKMTVPANLAYVFRPSPVTTAHYHNYDQVFAVGEPPQLAYSQDSPMQCDETMTEYSLGSLSTPMKTSEKSAFTPVSIADMQNRTSPDFYQPFFGMTGTLYEVVGISATAASIAEDDAKAL
jgi:hypothetical protein